MIEEVSTLDVTMPVNLISYADLKKKDFYRKWI